MALDIKDRISLNAGMSSLRYEFAHADFAEACQQASGHIVIESAR